MGARQWYIVGVYIMTKNTETMERVVEEIRNKPRGAELMVAGDLTLTSRHRREIGGRRTLRRI